MEMQHASTMSERTMVDTHASAVGAGRWRSCDGDADRAGALRRPGADDAECARRWHAYHLIGDVLRSEDLARDTGVATRLSCSALRDRLADASRCVLPARRCGRRRRTGVRGARGRCCIAGGRGGVSAGCVACVGRAARRAPATAAAGRRPRRGVDRAAAGGLQLAPTRADAGDAVAHGKLIRDARLDRYLAAHQQAPAARRCRCPPASCAARTIDAGGSR